MVREVRKATTSSAGSKQKFRIKNAGFSAIFQHSFEGKPVHFKDGRFETSDKELIEHLKGRPWCEAVR